jgi:hypothetical protein
MKTFRSNAEHAEHAEEETSSRVSFFGGLGWSRPDPRGSSDRRRWRDDHNTQKLGVLGVLGV